MRVIAWLSLVVMIGSFLCRPLADPDLWWHITVGKWIVAHKDVPHVDYWNLFGAGNPWRAYSWSNEVVYALVDTWYKHTGLAWLQLLLGLALALTIMWVFGVLAGDYFLGSAVGIVATVACKSHFSLRPQTLIWILFTLVILCAELSNRHGAKKRYLLALFALGCAWANTHISAIFGVVCVALWPLTGGLTRQLAYRIGLLVAFFVAGTFISPYLGGEWLTLLSKSDHMFSFRSLDEFKLANLNQVPTLCLLFQVVALGILSYYSRQLPALGGMLVAAIMIAVGTLAVKFIPFACIAVGALTAVWLRSAAINRVDTASNGLLNGLLLLKRFFASRDAQTLGACAFFVGCIGWVNIAKATRQPVNYSATPKYAVDFMEAHSLQHPVLSDFMSGGYLQYRWSSPAGEPRHLVPLDGRTNVNRRDVWESYMHAFRGSEKWRDYLAKVNPQTIIWRQGSPLVPLLLEAPEWCRVFESGKRVDSFAVFIKREEFERRQGEFTSSDCQAEEDGLAADKAPESPKSEKPVCKDLCGDGVCQEIVCMAVGCPCPESPSQCPADCKQG
jgi:hypothetical protein